MITDWTPKLSKASDAYPFLIRLWDYFSSKGWLDLILHHGGVRACQLLLSEYMREVLYKSMFKRPEKLQPRSYCASQDREASAADKRIVLGRREQDAKLLCAEVFALQSWYHKMGRELLRGVGELKHFEHRESCLAHKKCVINALTT